MSVQLWWNSAAVHTAQDLVYSKLMQTYND